jgi:type IV secretory pathway ATPase VirB11/archaellum biosynthesis ATPase
MIEIPAIGVSILFAIMTFIIGIAVTQLYNELLKRALPKAYDVAIIGFPKSGKTTLITALFGEIFASRITTVEATLRGQSTIERVNHDLAKLEMGEAVGPTTDQDLFAYRTTITGTLFAQEIL